jgi:hypothetical protein
MSKEQWGHGYREGYRAGIKARNRPVEVEYTYEMFLMLAAMENQQRYEILRSTLSPEYITDPNARELFVCMEEAYRDKIFTEERIAKKCSFFELREYVLQNSGLTDIPSDGFYYDMVHDYLDDIRGEAS